MRFFSFRLIKQEIRSEQSSESAKRKERAKTSGWPRRANVKWKMKESGASDLMRSTVRHIHNLKMFSVEECYFRFRILKKFCVCTYLVEGSDIFVPKVYLELREDFSVVLSQSSIPLKTPFQINSFFLSGTRFSILPSWQNSLLGCWLSSILDNRLFRAKYLFSFSYFIIHLSSKKPAPKETSSDVVGRLVTFNFLLFKALCATRREEDRWKWVFTIKCLAAVLRFKYFFITYDFFHCVQIEIKIRASLIFQNVVWRLFWQKAHNPFSYLHVRH